MSTPPPWTDFLHTLEQCYGHAALAARHEIYFLNRRPYARLRSVAALVRDTTLLMRGARNAMDMDAQVYLVATLAGPSGWQTLERAQQALPAGTRSRVIAHPRVKLEGVPTLALSRPSWGDVGRALRRAGPWLTRARGPISGVVVATCMARHSLWQAAWQRTFPTARPLFVLHNDFDMMSHALVAAFNDTAPIACIQHGIPTDEFFPTNAPTQVVWGQTSHAAYASACDTKNCIIDALSRGVRTQHVDAAPTRLLLLSQTHTPIYGTDLLPLFRHLAQALTAGAAKYVSILLHPMESPAIAYPAALHPFLNRPPHAVLTASPSPEMVVGYSTTAMLDAACAGHYVMGMAWPAHASKVAHAIAQPPMMCTDADEVLAYFETLRTDAAARTAHHHAQEAWLQQTYQSSGNFSAWVATCIR
jgi:hypothetical protein